MKILMWEDPEKEREIGGKRENKTIYIKDLPWAGPKILFFFKIECS